MATIVTFLRGINVGGHHKVPMSELKELFEKLGHTNVTTLLNSGNVISTAAHDAVASEEGIAQAIEERFGFAVPVVVRSKESILNMFESDPFGGVEVVKSTRLYVTFVWGDSSDNPSELFSVVDLEEQSTLDALADIEKRYKKKVTTRNWNTIKRIASKLSKVMNEPIVNEPIIIEELFDAPVEKVWEAITNYDHMVNWYFDQLPNFRPEPGFKVSFVVENPPRTFTHNWEVQKVKEVKLISYTWNYDEYPGDSLLEMHLKNHNGGTHLKLMHFTTVPFPSDIPEFERESGVMGWTYFIKERLASYLKS